MFLKIKSTNPKVYIVKPNKGELISNESITIEFHMQIIVFLILNKI